MRSCHPYSILHLHAEGAVAITHKPASDGQVKPHFFYQSPKATGSLEMALKRFFGESRKDYVYINLVSEAASLQTFADFSLIKEPDAFAQVLEANSGIAEKDCDVQFLESDNAELFEGRSSLLANCSKRSDFLRAQALASELGFENFELFNNTLSISGALADWRNESQSQDSVAILEIGTNSSTITISSPEGILGSRKIPVSIQDIAESIQNKLQLKFESAALLLFYNGIFDFSQHQAGIAENFSQKLTPVLKELGAKFSVQIDRLLISTIPPSYGWFSKEVSIALGLKGFSSSDFSFLKNLPLFGDSANNPGFIGLAYCAHSQPGKQSWMAPMGMQVVSVACKMSQGFTVGLPVEETIEPPTQKVNQPQNSLIPNEIEDASSVEEPVPFFEEGSVKEFLNESTDVFGESETEEVFFEEKTKEDPVQVITFKDQKTENPQPIEKKQFVSQLQEEESEKSKLGPIFGGIAALIIVGCGGLFYFLNAPKPIPVPVPKPVKELVKVEATSPYEAFKAEIKTIKENPIVEVAKIEEPKQILPPVKAKIEKAPEVESVNLIEIAEVEAPPAAPLGSLFIDTTPAGATVWINGNHEGTSPVTVDQLQFGAFSIELKLDGYISKLLDVTVESTDSQIVKTDLDLPVGTLEVSTTPEGVSFDLVSVEGLDRIIFSGVSPVTIPDIKEGDYEVQFSREDWDDYSESVTVQYNETSRVDLVYPEGWVMITSNPDNASVFEKGVFLGKTPLRIKGLKVGQKTFTVRQSGYEDTELTTDVVTQSEQHLKAELLNWDREVNHKDLDHIPVQTKGGLSSLNRLVGNSSHRFLVEFVINAEGKPEKIEVLETTYLRAHDRLINDISDWEFEPGIRKEHPVKTRVRIPVILGDVAKLPPVVELARAEEIEE
ncbi:MAG: PEGA domain-containing protein [Verrucomicrobia bacterium]|nr:PEGA domain-containing protein [Verrucomicrobiota bacterium]MDA1068054.1 PEGA domain-containing protein [Verrucomicrobiota bacterium]